MVPSKYNLVMKNYPNSWSTNENKVESFSYNQIHHLKKNELRKKVTLYTPSE